MLDSSAQNVGLQCQLDLSALKNGPKCLQSWTQVPFKTGLRGPHSWTQVASKLDSSALIVGLKGPQSWTQ